MRERVKITDAPTWLPDVSFTLCIQFNYMAVPVYLHPPHDHRKDCVHYYCISEGQSYRHTYTQHVTVVTVTLLWLYTLISSIDILLHCDRHFFWLLHSTSPDDTMMHCMCGVVWWGVVGLVWCDMVLCGVVVGVVRWERSWCDIKDSFLPSCLPALCTCLCLFPRTSLESATSIIAFKYIRVEFINFSAYITHYSYRGPFSIHM